MVANVFASHFDLEVISVLLFDSLATDHAVID